MKPISIATYYQEHQGADLGGSYFTGDDAARWRSTAGKLLQVRLSGLPELR
jgi:hypothetical protein